MADDRSQMMFDILLGIQSDIDTIKREVTSLGLRMSSMEDHMRGLITSVYGVQTDIADLKMRVDRIERRLGMNETHQ